MKITTILQVETGKTQNVEVTAFSNDTANIYITAADLQEATALLSQGQELATEAMKNWKPEKQPVKEEPQEHYIVSRHSEEEMKAAAEEYEASPAGQRFKKELQNAAEFELKHSKGILNTMQLRYLINKHQNNLYYGSAELIALAYSRGYRNGKKARK